MEWETTVEQATVVEKISDDTLIFLQLHKRVWPAAQRDALFWSHMRPIPSSPGRKAYDIADTWIVCNQSTKHPDAPENQGGCIRVDLTVCFVCDTFIEPPYTKDTAKREHLTTKITYCSVVNPGGWAPASVLRAVYKREYPRFLKRFTQYVDEKSKGTAIYW
jgi:collagen type IV alpha-3-binding protein